MFQWLLGLGLDESDDAEIRLKKSLLTASTLMMASLAVFWGALYAWAGETLSAAIPWGYSVLSFAGLIYFAFSHRAIFLTFSQLLLSLMLPVLLAFSLGNFMASSAVIIWSVTSPLGALVFLSRRQSVWWFVSFGALVFLYAAAAAYLPSENNLTLQLIRVFFVMNIMGTCTVAFLLMLYFANQRVTIQSRLAEEQKRAEALLLNILPAEIANALKAGPHQIAEEHKETSILFADIVGFTREMNRRGAEQMVAFLNEVHSYFDELTDRYKVEKIRTIGDAYMVVAGAPSARADHAPTLARLALDMRDYAGRRLGEPHFSLRIGIASGPIIAGVIGQRKFCYDVWGDTVNLASRLEASCKPGHIQISESTRTRLDTTFIVTPRGEIEIRGQPTSITWWLGGQAVPDHSRNVDV